MKKNIASIASSGAILATLAAFCWGSATVMAKSVLYSFSPVFLLVIQLIASAAFLWIYLFFRRAPLPRLPVSDIAKFASLGLLEPGLAYLLALIGLDDTQASNATLIGAMEAIMIIGVSALLFRVKPSLMFVALSVVAVFGLLIAIGAFSESDQVGGSLVGDAFVFAGTLTAAFYVVISGQFAARIDPVYIVAWQQVVALVFALVLLPVEWLLYPGTQILESATPGVWSLAALSGIVEYALAFSFYIAAMRTISANYAGSFLNLIPVFGLACAFLFLGERLSPLQLGGALITIIAVTLINRRVKSPEG